MIYLDTSAFIKLFVVEAESASVQMFVLAQNNPLPVWQILEAELTNALYLKAFRKELTSEEAGSQVKRLQQFLDGGYCYRPVMDWPRLMQTFMRLSAKTPQTGCRAFDILHVACALQLGADAFLTFDKRQRELAIQGGLDVPELN